AVMSGSPSDHAHDVTKESRSRCSSGLSSRVSGERAMASRRTSKEQECGRAQLGRTGLADMISFYLVTRSIFRYRLVDGGLAFDELHAEIAGGDSIVFTAVM